MSYRHLLVLPALLFTLACGQDDAPSDDPGSTGSSPASTGTPTPGGTTPSGTTTPEPTTDGPTTDTPTTTAADSTTGVGGAGVCRYRCESATDCFIEGADVQLTCDAGDCFTACEDAPDCVPSASGWVYNPCETNRECPGGVCVDYGTGLGCGREPSKQVDCVAAGLEEVEATDVDGNTVTVCGDTSWSCDAERCAMPTSDCAEAGCLDGLTCTDEGSCRCDNDDACLLAGLGNACRADGTCATACDDVNACGGLTFAFDGGAVVCE